MKSLRMKLFTAISMFVVALALLIVGVWAVGETQTITMNGSVNFEIADKSLYVKDVRMQEDVNSAPYSLKDQGKFLPGFINGNFDMNLGDFTNNYGSFALYFDIINTMDETTSETFAYTVDQPTAPSGTTVSVSILNTDGTTLEQIPQGTVKPSEISDSTLVTATIKLTIASTSSSTVDLSDITITINQYIPEVYDYFTFKVNDDGKTVTLTDYDSSLSDNTDIVIPATVSQNSSGEWIEGNTYTVTAIADGGSTSGVFYDSGITSVTFPSSLTSIGDYAFYRCSGLTSISLPSSLTSIGDRAFYNCTNLQPSATDQGVKYLGNNSNPYLVLWAGTGVTSTIYKVNSNCKFIHYAAFSNCSGLTSISLPSSLTSIGSFAFGYCGGLTSVDLSGCTSLTSIGNEAFYNCSRLTSVDLNGCTSLTSIGDSAFNFCSRLTSVDLNGCTSLTSIGSYAFYDCSGLTSISLPSSLTSIGSWAFIGCSRLTSVDLNGCTSLTSIGDYAFQSCSGLTSISLPSSLKAIGSYAFNGCSDLESVVFPEGSTGWYVTTSSTATSGDPVDVTNSNTNASNLTGQYVEYYWKRNV